MVVILLILATYAILIRMKKRWMAIPISALVAGGAVYMMGVTFKFVTTPGIPDLNPFFWWGENTGWMIGFPSLSSLITVVPFALLGIAMWPPDFLGHRIFQETHYPATARKCEWMWTIP